MLTKYRNMNQTCDCIIPFYNEGLRPLYVVKSLLKVKSISKIIVVDDGSASNKTYLQLKTQFPSIIVIRLEKNSGKANAVKHGLKHVNSDYVFLIDGDISNIITAEIENVINTITSYLEIDMILLRRVADKTVVFSRFIRHDIIFSGQRILRTKDLIQVLKNKVYGYNLESAVNSYMIENNKHVYWMPSTIHNLFKHEKWGIQEGFFQKGILGFVKFMCSRDIFYQTFFFCRTQAP